MERRKRTFIIAALSIVLGLGIGGYKIYNYIYRSSFIESWDRDYYMVNAVRLNETLMHTMDLKENDEITVHFVKQAGRFVYDISSSDGKRLYHADDAGSAEFTIEVPKDDTYVFVVGAKRGIGTLIFRVNE